MNLTKFLARAAGTALLPAALVLVPSNPAHAFGVEFTPVGTQLDNDIISDLEIPVGTPTQDFSFQVNVGSFGLFPFLQGQTLSAFVYDLGFDATEWDPNALSIAACNASAFCATDPGVPPGDPSSGSGVTNAYEFTLNDGGLGIIPISSGASPFFFPGPITGILGATLPNDGDADLLGTLRQFTVTNSNNVSTTYVNGQTGDPLLQTVIFGSQSISLQNPTEVPGPLPILGAGAAFGYSRRLRKRMKQVSAKV